MLQRRVLTAALAIVLLPLAAPVRAAAKMDPELRTEVERSIDRGLKWLRTQMKENGSYENVPGITAIAVLSFLRSHRRYREDDGPFVRKPIEYLVANAHENGSIHNGDNPVYHTALALLALEDTENPKHRELIEKGQAYLAGQQADEGEDYRPEDKFYGGIGYGNDERPDLSNLQFALEALHETGYAKDEEAWKRALTFLERCQNRSESNDQEWAGNDGGFVYSPDGRSFAGEYRSYGSMSYAGLKSLIYANVTRDDPRVQDAVKWVRHNYSVEEHPGMGDTALFYYYRTMAQALAAYGEPVLSLAGGEEVDWYESLAEKLMAMQKPEGYWQNDNPKYWEGNPVMATSWALLSLEEGLRRDEAAEVPATKPAR